MENSHREKELLEAQYPIVEFKGKKVKFNPLKHELEVGELAFFLDTETSIIRQGVVESIAHSRPARYPIYTINGRTHMYHRVWPVVLEKGETYAERELVPLGFRKVEDLPPSRRYKERLILSISHLRLVFECVCPAFPSIKAMGCPLHHEGPGGSWPISEAAKIASVLK